MPYPVITITRSGVKLSGYLTKEHALELKAICEKRLAEFEYDVTEHPGFSEPTGPEVPTEEPTETGDNETPPVEP